MKCRISLIFTIVALTFAYSFQFAVATETITLDSIAERCVSNIGVGEEDLTVHYEEGLVWISYVAFNLSEIPSGVEIDSVKLKLRTYFVVKSTWVSAFNCSSKWVETGITWDSRPDLDRVVATKWVSVHNEWYTWQHLFLTNAVKSALNRTGILALALKSHVFTDVEGHVIFYPYAELEIKYILDTIAPDVSDIITQPTSPAPDAEVTVNASVTDNESGVREVNLLYSTDEGVSWMKLPMSQVKDAVYSGALPRQDQGTSVQYYVEAFDNAGNRKESSEYSYTVRSKEEPKLPDLSEIPLWVIVVAAFILFGLPVIGVIAIVYFVRRRRQAKEPTVSARFDKFLRSNLISNIG